MAAGHQLALLALIGATWALDIQVENSGIISRGWVEYTRANAKFPQCCQSSDCAMVRISPDVTEAVKRTGLSRAQIHDSNGKIVQGFVAYDEKTGGLFGKIYRDDGMIQTLAPTEASDLSQDANCKAPFHKLYSDGGRYSSAPVPLFSLYTAPQQDSCCQEGATCYKVSKNIDDSALRRNHAGDFPDLYLPRFKYPNIESDVFFLTLKEPSDCQGRLCNIYQYRNAKNERLDIANTPNGITVDLSSGDTSSSLISCSRSSKSWQTRSTSSGSSVSGLAAGGRAAPGESCWDLHSYCNPLVFAEYFTVLERADKTDEELIMECYNMYNTAGLSNPDITHFTIHFTRRAPNCYLLSGCDRIFDDVCIGLNKCTSGPAGSGDPCGPLGESQECDVPPENGAGFLRWQCVNIQGERLGPFSHGDTLPPFTTCLQACNSWRTTPEYGSIPGYIYSECQRDGTWSSPEVLPAGATLAYPEAPYPTPDAGSSSALTCGCPSLHLIYDGVSYNPNVEEGADFVCENQPAAGPSGEMVIETGNQCYLYCDEVLALSTKCVSDSWTGQPDRGFWCFSPPSNRILGVPNFSIQQYEGLWYVQSSNVDTDRRCGRLSCRRAYGAIGILEEFVQESSGQAVSTQGLAKWANPYDAGNAAALYYVTMLNFDENDLNQIYDANYFVIKADYTSHAVYLFDPEGARELRIVTRAQFPSQSLMDRIMEELSYMNVDTSTLVSHAQTNCEALPPLN